MASRIEAVRNNWIQLVASQPGGKSSEPLEVRHEHAIEFVDSTFVILYGHRDDWPEVREELIERLTHLRPLPDSDPEGLLQTLEKLLGRRDRQ